ISTDQLLTTSSHEISLYIVIKALIAPGDKVVVATPSYYLPNMTLSNCGAQIISVPIEDDGISTHQLKKVLQDHKIRILYLTSNYHYPTTNVLSATKRMEILELARLHDFVVVEDDYEYDFHHDNNPLLPLAALDANERVVYISSFGKSLPSGFAYGFITAPSNFIIELEKHLNILEPGTDVIKEQVITEWIKDGEVHRLAKKNRKIYTERRDHFVLLLAEKFKERIQFKTPSRGLAVWVEWLDDINLVKLQKECAKYGLFLPTTILYQNKNLRATRLGFGHLEKTEMDEVLKVLRKALSGCFADRS
ncbi:MAG: PLP-dependent aminotransferase family protein, partial [Pedobacter sp.]